VSSSDAVCEDAAGEVAVDGLLERSPEEPVGWLEAILVDREEALDLVRERAVERRSPDRRLSRQPRAPERGSD